MTNATSTSHFAIFESNLVVVKAMIFERREAFKAPEYATVLCCVPKEHYGRDGLFVSLDGKKYPDSFGTFIRVRGRELMAPNEVTSLTRYEYYLKKEGWEFTMTIKSAKNKTKAEAFSLCHTMIKALRMMRR